MNQIKVNKKRLVLSAILVVIFFAAVFNHFGTTGNANSKDNFHTLNAQATALPVDTGVTPDPEVSTRIPIPPASLTVGKMPKSSAGVPKILHFMYRIQHVINPYKKGFETCTRHNKDWLFVFWDEANLLKFIRDKFPGQFEYFVSLPHRLQRFDAARYLLLYYYGGVYLDLDMHCQKPLLSTLDNFPCYVDCERPEFSQITFNMAYSAMNSAMGCRPGHPFFKQLIDTLLHPGLLLNTMALKELTVEVTGPWHVTRTYEAFKKEHPDTDVKVLNASYFTPKFYTDFSSRCQPELNKVAKPGEWRTIGCQTLSRIGFKKALDAYVNNSTVAIHQFLHLGYKTQAGNTFDIREFRPAMKFYSDLNRMGL